MKPTPMRSKTIFLIITFKLEIILVNYFNFNTKTFLFKVNKHTQSIPPSPFV